MGSNTDGRGTKVSRLRQYDQGHPGPFIVIAEAATGNIPSTRLSSEICEEYGRQYIRAVSISKRKIKLLMASGSAANRLVQKRCDNIKFTIPQRLVECMGVAYIETDVTDEELKEAKGFEKSKLYQFDSPKVLDVRRIIRNDTKMPTRTVVLTFNGTQLPSHVELSKVLYSLKPYVYRVRQCKKCWRFGHHSDNCKSTSRCKFCVTKDVQEDHQCDIDQPKCVNCGGEHRADDTRCSIIQQKREQEKDRQTSHSQGSIDWFSQLASTHQRTQPEQPLISPCTSEQTIITIEDGANGPSAKRKCTDNEDQEVSNRDNFDNIRIAINEKITSVEVIDKLAIALSNTVGTEEDLVPSLQTILNTVFVPVVDEGFRRTTCSPRL